MERITGNIKNTVQKVQHKIKAHEGTVTKTLTAGGAVVTTGYTIDNNRKTEIIKRCEQVSKVLEVKKMVNNNEISEKGATNSLIYMGVDPGFLDILDVQKAAKDTSNRATPFASISCTPHPKIPMTSNTIIIGVSALAGILVWSLLSFFDRPKKNQKSGQNRMDY